MERSDDSPTPNPRRRSFSRSQRDSRSSSPSREEPDDDRTRGLLAQRQRLTDLLHELPYDPIRYLERAAIHADLGYPDLAAGDAYKALLLADEVREEGGEYHDVALAALSGRVDDDDWHGVFGERGRRKEQNGNGNGEERHIHDHSEDRRECLARLAGRASVRCYQILSISLLLCGCLKSAYEFCTRGLCAAPNDEELLQAQEYIQKLARRRLKLPDAATNFDINDLPDQGLVRREIYPWNDHEPNRFAPETIDFLNNELASVAPKCEVRATELPTLLESAMGEGGTNLQLGLFAKEDVYKGEVVLDEFSILTANNRLKASLCDACSSQLPRLDAPVEQQAIPCEDCADTLFCSRHCYETAMNGYHPAICDKDIDTIAKDPDPKETPNALYLLLLARSFAMAETRELHPLDLKEVKYIHGDFLPTSLNEVPLSPRAGPPPIWTLPFSFASNISGPFHVLEKMDIDIFKGVKEYDLWVINTMYAKFRGTASARVSIRDGRPEVAAVHALWCLANHDCAPNVGWEWGGRMRFFARDFPGAPLANIGPEALYRNQSESQDTSTLDSQIAGTVNKDVDEERDVAIAANTEILSHYCDIELPVKERREWAKGSLGGWCMCARCVRESAAEEAESRPANGHGDENQEELMASLRLEEGEASESESRRRWSTNANGDGLVDVDRVTRAGGGRLRN